MTDATRERETRVGKCFGFGENRVRFLPLLKEVRIQHAEQSLREIKMLGVTDLRGLRFLDAGSGSSLFSLAARRLGAQVHSFDYDPRYVACARLIKQRYIAEDAYWAIEEGSVLDAYYLARLGEFDVMYRWGVVHHTGQMWLALGNVAASVTPQGQLVIGIYNGQEWLSRYWVVIKELYVRHRWLRWPLLLLAYVPYLVGVRWLVRAATGRLRLDSDIALWHDLVDWVGGYPFEVARLEKLLHSFRDKSFWLRAMKTCAGRAGCNEHVFMRTVVGRQGN